MSKERQEDGGRLVRRKKRDLHEIRLAVVKVKFAKHIMVSASDLLACVTAARKDCTSHSVG
jgi:hypothetical protein